MSGVHRPTSLQRISGCTDQVLNYADPTAEKEGNRLINQSEDNYKAQKSTEIVQRHYRQKHDIYIHTFFG